MVTHTDEAVAKVKANQVGVQRYTGALKTFISSADLIIFAFSHVKWKKLTSRGGGIAGFLHGSGHLQVGHEHQDCPVNHPSSI